MISLLLGSHIPSSLSELVLVDRHGLPRYWTADWSAAVTGALADSTHIKKLRYIDNLCQHGDELRGYGALDDALGTLNDGDLAEILESWFISIRNQAATTEADETRWQVGLSFVTSVVSWIAKSDTHKTLRQIESRLHQLSVLYSQFTKPTQAGLTSMRNRLSVTFHSNRAASPVPCCHVANWLASGCAEFCVAAPRAGSPPRCSPEPCRRGASHLAS